MSWSNAKLDWVAVLDTIAENETDEIKRRYRYNLVLHKTFVFREMWDLINVNDCEALTIAQLESGMATVTRYSIDPHKLSIIIMVLIKYMYVCRTEDFFDCFPAVEQAAKFTKIISFEMSQEEDRGNKDDAVKNPLEFGEFGTFLKLLHQYYVYCQV